MTQHWIELDSSVGRSCRQSPWRTRNSVSGPIFNFNCPTGCGSVERGFVIHPRRQRFYSISFECHLFGVPRDLTLVALLS